jgi:hypothetical protein
MTAGRVTTAGVEMLRPELSNIAIGLRTHAKVDVYLEPLSHDPRALIAKADRRLARAAPELRAPELGLAQAQSRAPL